MPSLRELARSLSLSHTTVSQALRGSPRVKAATQQRVVQAAEAAGYRRNPLAGALMSEMRRSRTGTFRGVLALLDLDGPDKRPAGATRYHRELAEGASHRAEELGFKAEPFTIGRKGISLERLDTILQSRGIRGVFLLPVREQPDLTRLDWSHFAGIYSDYVIEKPNLHAVCPDHYRSMMIVLQRLQSLGYRRPGLALHQAHDERLLFRWEAAFDVYRSHHRELAAVRPLVVPELTEPGFAKWFTTEKPDVVLGHNLELVSWMLRAGARVPQTHGFCCLNVTTAEKPCAGLDLQPRLLGARGLELLIGQLLRNEYGVPGVASTTTIPAQWVDGPTLRPQP